MKKVIALAALTLTSCGGHTTEKIVYMPATDAPVKSSTTTDAPVTVPVPVYTAEDEFIFDIETSYGPILMDKDEVIGVGYSTCAFLRQGGTSDDLMWAMQSASAGGGEDFIIAVVASAITNFCPDQAWKIN